MSKSCGRFQSICLGSAIAVVLLMAANAYAESPATSQHGASSTPPTKGFFPRYAAASTQVRALLCSYGMGSRSAALAMAGTEHGGLAQADAEAAWDAIDKASTQEFVYNQLARVLDRDTFDAAGKAALEAAISVSQEDPEHVHQNEAQLAEVCGNAYYSALKAKGDLVGKIEAIYRDELAKDRAHAKARFMEQATRPFHP